MPYPNNLDLDNDFTYHPPKGDQPDRYGKIREVAKGLAATILALTPTSAEQDLAYRAVQQAVMWANCAISCNKNPITHATSSPPEFLGR